MNPEEVVHTARSDPILKNTHVAELLARLSEDADADGVVIANAQTLAGEIGIARTGLQYRLSRAAQEGYLEILDSGRGKPTTYRMTVPTRPNSILVPPADVTMADVIKRLSVAEDRVRALEHRVNQLEEDGAQ